MDRTEINVSNKRVRLALMRVWTLVGLGIVAFTVFGILGRISSVLILLAVGCLVAYVSAPVVNALERLGVPRSLGALVAVLLVALLAFLLLFLLVPIFLSQATSLLRELPWRITQTSDMLVQIIRDHDLARQVSQFVDPGEIIGSLQGLLTTTVSGLLSMVGSGLMPAISNIAQGLFLVFLGLVMAYWVARDYPRINEEICLVLGERRSADYRLLSAVISRSVGGYLRSTLFNSCFQGCFAFLAFSLIGHPYAGVLGVVAGALNFVPVVGPAVSNATATLVALFYSPSLAVATFFACAITQSITDNLVAPRVSQQTLQIHPVLSLTALALGSALLGTIGMVVAIPLCAIARGLFIFYFESRTATQLVSYEGALFKGTPYLDEEGRPAPASDALADPSFVDDPTRPICEGDSCAVPVPREATAWERAGALLARAERGVVPRLRRLPHTPARTAASRDAKGDERTPEEERDLASEEVSRSGPKV